MGPEGDPPEGEPPDVGAEDELRPYCRYRKSTATAASHQMWFSNPRTTRTTVPEMTMVPITGLRGRGLVRAVIGVCDGALGEERPAVGA
jgi:hypothetical protein